MLKAVIFDVDGTLVHSVRCSEASLIALFAERGVKLESVDFTPFIGACEKLAIEAIAAAQASAFRRSLLRARTSPPR